MTDYNFNYSKLTGKIVEVFGSQREYAKFMGWAERTASDKLNNKAQYKQNEVMKTLCALGLSTDDIPTYFFTINAQKHEVSTGGDIE